MTRPGFRPPLRCRKVKNIAIATKIVNAIPPPRTISPEVDNSFLLTADVEVCLWETFRFVEKPPIRRTCDALFLLALNVKQISD